MIINDYLIHEFARRLEPMDYAMILAWFNSNKKETFNSQRSMIAQQKFEELNAIPKKRKFDFITELAANYFGIPVEDVTPLQRKKVKDLLYIYRYYGNK